MSLFYNDSVYIAEDYHIDLSDEVDGVEQDFTQAVFSGGVRLGLEPLAATFTFTPLNATTMRCTIDSTKTILLSEGSYDMGVRVRYNDRPETENDYLLIQGKLEVNKTLF